MKLQLFHCAQCGHDDADFSISIEEIEVNDKYIYERECSKGHISYTVLQNLPFEILFELGIHALADGYPDSACIRFSVSCERFYEFCIKVLAVQNGVAVEGIESYWKKIGANSQAQLGAFITFYEIEKFKGYSTLPTLLMQKKLPFGDKPNHTEFRNNVVHKGCIPSYDEAQIFGQEVYEFITSMSQFLCLNYHQAIEDITFLHMHKAFLGDSEPQEMLRSTMHIPTVVSALCSNTVKPFEDVVAQIKNKKYCLIK